MLKYHWKIAMGSFLLPIVFWILTAFSFFCLLVDIELPVYIYGFIGMILLPADAVLSVLALILAIIAKRRQLENADASMILSIIGLLHILFIAGLIIASMGI